MNKTHVEIEKQFQDFVRKCYPNHATISKSQMREMRLCFLMGMNVGAVNIMDIGSADVPDEINGKMLEQYIRDLDSYAKLCNENR